MSVKSAELTVLGMSCMGCAARVEKAIREKAAGVESVRVDLGAKKAVLSYDPDKTDLAGIASVVEKAGYQAVLPGN